MRPPLNLSYPQPNSLCRKIAASLNWAAIFCLSTFSEELLEKTSCFDIAGLAPTFAECLGSSSKKA